MSRRARMRHAPSAGVEGPPAAAAGPGRGAAASAIGNAAVTRPGYADRRASRRAGVPEAHGVRPLRRRRARRPVRGAEFRCVFLGGIRQWSGIDRSSAGRPAPASPRHAAAAMAALLDRRQVVVADFPARALDARSLARCARILSGSVDATLAGDSGSARVQYSPSLRASLIRREGLAVWSGVNCRDRNRVALEGELAGLAEVGVAGVHCVTGDHTRTGDRPDAEPVFDLDSTELAALARAAGHLVSVAESPAAPPVATGRRACSRRSAPVPRSAS